MTEESSRRRRKAARRNRGLRVRLRLPAVDVSRAALGVATVIALTALMAAHFLPDKVSLRVGDRSPIEIRAPHSATYVDTIATQRQRDFAASRVGPVYVHDASASADADGLVDDVFDRLRDVRAASGTTSTPDAIEQLVPALGMVLDHAQLRYLLTITPPQLERLHSEARRLVDSAMNQEIREQTDDLHLARMRYDHRAAQAVAGFMDLSILRAIGFHAIRPNLVISRARTAQARAQAVRAVRPILGEIRTGDIILRPGDVFTQLAYDQCKALGLIRPQISLTMLLSLLALTATMVSIVVFYIRRSRPAIYQQYRLLVLLAAIVVLSVFGLKVFGNFFGFPLSGLQLGYLGVMMTVAAAMLIAALLDTSLAVLVSSLLAVLCGLIMNHELRFAALALVMGFVGVYCVTHIRDRGHLVATGAALGGTGTLMAWALGGVFGDSISEMGFASLCAVIASALAMSVFWIGVAMLEKPFGILTHVWLLELSSSDRPLLRRLCMEAPGTYAHSIMVGNLAEAAAEAIGADALFCRVASYYHDIGKLRRPDFFIENQRGANPHDELHPSLSALIVASHVRDGLDLAREYRVPEQVAEVIATHHGTSLIHFFYHRVLFERGCVERDPVLEQHFRYEGPRPRTRESGIIMLADTVEAAARALDRPSAARLSGLVDTLVQDKLADGQLDDCGLTLRDLHGIRAAFVRVLSGMLHGRVDYPELPGTQRDLMKTRTSRQELADADLPTEVLCAQTQDSLAGTGGPPRTADGG